MGEIVLISVLGPDRAGLVAAVAGRVYELGGNLGDTTFAVLGEGCELSTVVELPDDLSISELGAELGELPELEGAKLEVRPFEFEPVHAPSARITHRVELSGGDRPGIIARLSEVFANFGANIVRLNSEMVPGSGGASYNTRFAVAIPEARAAACLATVANIAGQLDLVCRWEKA
ncbi:MAG: ACT domain-containing protein [Alphaproteobacteria bacterium]